MEKYHKEMQEGGKEFDDTMLDAIHSTSTMTNVTGTGNNTLNL